MSVLNNILKPVAKNTVRSVLVNHGAVLNSFDELSPSELSAIVITSTRVDLSFTINSENADGHKVYRSTDDISYSLIYTIEGEITTYSDTSAEQSTIYYYKVTAYRGSSESGYSNSSAVLTPATILSDSSARHFKFDNLSKVTKDENDYVLEWEDENGGVSLLPNGTNYPLLTEDGLKTVMYGPIQSIMTATFTQDEPFEIYMLLYIPTWSNNATFLGFPNYVASGISCFSSTPQYRAITQFGFGIGNLIVSDWNVISLDKNTVFGTDNVTDDNGDVHTGDAGDANIGGIVLFGKPNSYGLENVIYKDVIVLNGIGTTDDKAAIRQYLQHRKSFFLT